MADTHDTIDGLLAEFRGYAAGMPDSYHVTMSWADFRKMLDRFDAAHKREVAVSKTETTTNAVKLREALEAIVDCGRRYDCDIQHCPYWDGSEGASYLGEAVDIARAALAATEKEGGNDGR